MVLHDIANDAELVEVAATALGAKGLLEGNLDVVDVVSVPGGAEELVAESENEDVLDHLLSEVVVDTEDLLLLPVGTEGAVKLARRGQVLAERLLNNDTGNALLGVGVLLQALGNGDEDGWGKSHVEDTVGLGLALLEALEVLLELLEALVVVVLSRHVGGVLAEVLELLLDLGCGGLDVALDTLEVLLVVHLCASISDNLDALGQVGIAVQAEQGREGLLLGEITRSTEDDDGGVLLELLVAAREMSATG